MRHGLGEQRLGGIAELSFDTVLFDLVCFDLDGTLVDTAPEIAEAVNRSLESHGLARRPVAEISLLIGAGLHALMRRLLDTCVQEQPALVSTLNVNAVLQTLDKQYSELIGQLSVPYDGCEGALRALRGVGVRLACVTNKELRHTHRVLAATGLAPLFDLVIGGDSLPLKKPHASVLQHAAHTLQVELKRTVHVGDSATDIAAAHNAGVTAWAVPYGYNGGRPIAQDQPDCIFDSLADVAQAVLGPRQTNA